MKKAIRELLCQKCDCDYPVWFVPDELWHLRDESIHFLCPTCFIMEYEKEFGTEFVWKVDKIDLKSNSKIYLKQKD